MIVINSNGSQDFFRWHVMQVLLCAFLASLAFAEEPAYDLVLRHGKIVDGTGNPWYSGDVGILGDRIVALGRIPIGKVKREIDVSGLIIAPGFIDIHSHSDHLLLEDGQAQSKLHQGVTTEVLGEGSSAGPYRGSLPSEKSSSSKFGLRLSETTSLPSKSRRLRSMSLPMLVSTTFGIA